MKEVFTYMLIPKQSVEFLPWLGGMCYLVHAQQHEVADIVKDKGSQFLPGVVVSVKPASNGVTTGSNRKHFKYNQI